MAGWNGVASPKRANGDHWREGGKGLASAGTTADRTGATATSAASTTSTSSTTRSRS